MLWEVPTEAVAQHRDFIVEERYNSILDIGWQICTQDRFFLNILVRREFIFGNQIHSFFSLWSMVANNIGKSYHIFTASRHSRCPTFTNYGQCIPIWYEKKNIIIFQMALKYNEPTNKICMHMAQFQIMSEGLVKGVTKVIKFSKHRPSGPMLSISRFVLMSICVSVCLSVCSFWGTV